MTSMMVSLVPFALVTWLAMFHDVMGDFSLTILHTNDVHDRIEQCSGSGGPCSNSSATLGECFGGVARRLTAIRELRQRHTNVLLVDTGDQFYGTLWFSVYGGDAAAYFMTKLGYDVMALGNHEFDLGPAGLGRFLRNVTFPVVSANTDGSQEPEIAGLYSKSVVLTIGGQQIGVIGYTTTDTGFISRPGDNVRFSDEVDAVRREAERLKATGVNILIALGHAGFEIDQQVAAHVGAIDVVVGGHSDTFLYSGTPPSDDQPEGDYPFMVTRSDGKTKTKPKKSRVLRVRVCCAECSVPTYQPLDDNAIYRVLINKFISDGGDGYSMIKERKLEDISLGVLVSDALAAYVRKMAPITQGLDDRITFEKENPGCETGGAATLKLALTLKSVVLLYWLYKK